MDPDPGLSGHTAISVARQTSETIDKNTTIGREQNSRSPCVRSQPLAPWGDPRLLKCMTHLPFKNESERHQKNSCVRTDRYSRIGPPLNARGIGIKRTYRHTVSQLRPNRSRALNTNPSGFGFIRWEK